MKLLILSDSHHSIDRLNKLLSIIEEEKIDIIIHAGDNFRDSAYLKEKSKKPVIGVIGNCIKDDTYMGGLLILNPGSLSQPRDGSRGSYVVMDVDNGSYQYNYFYI